MSVSPVWVWAIIGVLLIITELTTFTFILLFLGIGAIVTAVTTVIGLSSEINSQLLVFAITSILIMMLFRRIAKRLFYGTDDMPPEYSGQKVKVIKSISAGKEGQVEYRGSPWTAYSDSSDIISEGSIVEIVSLEGVRVKVKQIQDN